jgi:hypothetical protein
MDEPFQRIALDFVGPLPMPDSKNIPGQKNVA